MVMRVDGGSTPSCSALRKSRSSPAPLLCSFSLAAGICQSNKYPAFSSLTLSSCHPASPWRGSPSPQPLRRRRKGQRLVWRLNPPSTGSPRPLLLVSSLSLVVSSPQQRQPKQSHRFLARQPFLLLPSDGLKSMTVQPAMTTEAAPTAGRCLN